MHLNTRLRRASTALALLALSACSTLPTPPKLPIVLVHGAWSEASAWDQVAADLRARGYTVTAVNLPGHGADKTPADKLSLAGYAQAVATALPSDGKAVLVGHSMAGMVISQVAENAPQKVAKLVYVAAYLPGNGQSLYQLSQTDADSHVPKYWRQDNPQAYSPASIAADGVAEVFCADCSAEQQRKLVAGMKAEAIPPLGTPVQLSAGKFGSVPRAYLHTTQDNAVSYSLQKRMLSAAGGAQQTFTLASSHMPMLSQPKAVADAIVAAAQ